MHFDNWAQRWKFKAKHWRAAVFQFRPHAEYNGEGAGWHWTWDEKTGPDINWKPRAERAEAEVKRLNGVILAFAGIFEDQRTENDKLADELVRLRNVNAQLKTRLDLDETAPEIVAALNELRRGDRE